ncbi:hypothetical protein M7I_8342 [Glarea lozoyensis 74030]|uniref:Uncharacterized protein n=1 Tax=Glarea lozoyensis (strain ATCC 74030 / MF5533) TaxID=1104152 RepID=H0EZR4_GLAL7|nr:hypothetical protein M7I_8342 [Glarea lozoyensis 74030]
MIQYVEAQFFCGKQESVKHVSCYICGKRCSLRHYFREVVSSVDFRELKRPAMECSERMETLTEHLHHIADNRLGIVVLDNRVEHLDMNNVILFKQITWRILKTVVDVERDV